MRKNIIKILATTISLLSITISSTVCAESLMQVYQQALKNDPTYQEAISTWQAAKLNLPIARSYYLPTLTLEGDYSETTKKPITTGKYTTTDTSKYTATLTQQIFNYDIWSSIKEADYTVKAATATYFAAQQSLMQRVTNAYFDVLTSSEEVVFDKAFKRELYNQLVTNEQKYKVGLTSSVDVYTTKATYDTQVAQEIADQNTLRADLEALTAITNHKYKSLLGIKNSIPLLSPNPKSIDSWVTTSVKQNYNLQAQQYTSLAYKKDIQVQTGDALPIVYGTAGYLHDRSAVASFNPDYTAAGITVSYSPFTGGLNTNTIRQARYNYLAQSSLLEYTYRGVVQSTRTAYLGVMSNISQAQANEKTVLSSQKSLEATQAGYKVGTQSIDDVLTSMSQLYSSKVSYITNQYSYMAQLISLELNAGTLSAQNIATINKWLTKPVYFNTILSDTKNGLGSSITTPAKTKATNKTTTQATNNNGNYTIQLYAANKRQDAVQFQQHAPKGSTVIKSGNMYKVTTGSFNSLATARSALTTIQANYHDAWVVKS